VKLATLCYVKDTFNKTTLMLHRVKKQNDYHEGKWNGLGGKFEPGEGPEQCCIREVEEESGLQVIRPILRGMITFPLFDGKDDWYVFLFVIPEWRGNLIESPEGNLQWIPDDELLNLNLWDGDKIFIPWLEKEDFFSAVFNYENGQFKDYTVSFY